MDNGKHLIMVDEEELFGLMCDYGQIEDKLCKFLVVLEALAFRYEERGCEELHANLCVIRGYLEMLQKEFAKTISRTDKFLLTK